MSISNKSKEGLGRLGAHSKELSSSMEWGVYVCT